MNQLFAIGAEYGRERIMAIAGNRLRMVDFAAVARFDHDHWVLFLDEQNSCGWANVLEPSKVTMEVNTGKPQLNHMIRFAHSRGDKTFMFYREKSRPRGQLRYLGEVWCTQQLENFLIFARQHPPAQEAA